MTSCSICWQWNTVQNLSVLDKFTRECSDILVSLFVVAQDVTVFLTAILKNHPAPVQEVYIHVVVQVWLEGKRVSSVFIPACQPWKRNNWHKQWARMTWIV